MSPLQEIVEFAQTQFGNDSGVPNDMPEGRPRLPPWLEGRIGEGIPVEADDTPVIEDTPGKTTAGIEPRVGVSVEEFFAYYLPFHFYRTSWGIYIRAYGIDRLARLLTVPAPLTPAGVSFAFNLLLEHERLHFLAEIAASKLEVAFCQPSYEPYFRNTEAAFHEEAVANAHTLSSAKRGFANPLVKTASSWMSKQDPGYSDYHQWLGPLLPIGQRKASAVMVDAKPGIKVMGRVVGPQGFHLLTPRPQNWPGEFLFDERRRMRPPIYLVVDVPVPWLRVVKPFPKQFGLQVLVHTNDHKPPHIHIKSLKGGRETRYEWDMLRGDVVGPLPGDRRLSRSDEKSLHAYVKAFVDEIEAKVKTVPWS